MASKPRYLRILGLLALTLLCHFWLVPWGLGLLTADGGIYPMTADAIRQGRWTPFQLQDKYGGVALMAVRAAWVSTIQAIGGPQDWVYWLGHFSFSYAVVPALLTVFFYYAALSYCTPGGALVAGLLSAVGFNSRIIMGDTEFMNFYFMVGSVFLILKARFENPLAELKAQALLLLGLLTGFSAYTSRACLVYAVMFWVPWRWVWDELRVLRVAQFAGKRVWCAIAASLFALYVYLEVFGPDLGMIFGKRLKLHAQPNLNLAVLVVGLAWLQVNRARIKASDILKLVAVGAGFLIGFLPEIWFWAKQGMLPPLTGGRSYNFQDSFTALGKIPGSLMIISSGIVSGVGTGILRNFSIILMVLALVALVRAIRRSRKYAPLLITGALAMFSYARVMTYDLAPTRYLMPFFPVLVISMGVFWDDLKTSSKKWAVPLGAVLLLLHCVHQLHERRQLVKNIRESHVIESMLQVVGEFRKAGVDVVISDDFWFSNPYSVASQRAPIFASHDHEYVVPAEAYERAGRADRVGIFTKSTPAPRDQIGLLGIPWKLSPIGHVGDRDLYVGVRVSSSTTTQESPKHSQ